ncbi:MAG: D-glycero-alpha-D-manno-heptose-1,7-bisphosphate 7-phosphatase [Nitrososphaerales archaeon]
MSDLLRRKEIVNSKQLNVVGKAKTKAALLDRDGVICDLVYNKEEGQIGSPFSAKQLRVFPYVPDSIKALQKLGFKIFVISNQPGVAKKQFTYAEHNRMNEKIRKTLAKEGVKLDGEYFCLHHPYGLIPKYSITCDCRKPKPGLILQAAKENDLDLERSFFIGDTLSDVKAGIAAHCKTILIANPTGYLFQVMEEEKVHPDYMISSLKEAPPLIQKIENK